MENLSNNTIDTLKETDTSKNKYKYKALIHLIDT